MDHLNTSSTVQKIIGFLSAVFILISFVFWPALSKQKLSVLDSIKEKGVLNIVTFNGESTVTKNEQGLDGFEYQLASHFAQSIGVNAHFITAESFDDLYKKILFKDADIAAAGLSEYDTDSDLIEFSPRYLTVTSQVIYKKGNTRYKSLEAFGSNPLDIVNASNLKLIQQEAKHPLNVNLLNDLGAEEAIEMVNDGFIQYLLVDSHKFALQRRFYPELRIAFELKIRKSLKWMFKNYSEDHSLNDALQHYFLTIKEDGRLEQWVHRYLSHVEKFNYSDLKTFEKLLNTRLPKYETVFKQEANAQQLDWRLLAAIGYQESLWNAKAKSPTGVRGLMMLTKSTAKQVGIKNRLDPFQSIKGGAKYLKRVIAKIPERIQQPDRTWMALASYNVGFGHLEDARKITQIRGGDADKWIDVKESLPLLSRKKWYKKTKYGYARGAEPVKYVENIRKYYDLLVWYDKKTHSNNVKPEQTIKTLEAPILAPL